MLDNTDQFTRLVVSNPRHCVRHDNFTVLLEFSNFQLFQAKALTTFCAYSRELLTVLFNISRQSLTMLSCRALGLTLQAPSVEFYKFSGQCITTTAPVFHIFFFVLHDVRVSSTWIDAKGCRRRLLLPSARSGYFWPRSS